MKIQRDLIDFILYRLDDFMMYLIAKLKSVIQRRELKRACQLLQELQNDKTI